jgi:hypothetical protein
MMGCHRAQAEGSEKPEPPMVKVRDGRISNWREYQYRSTLPWAEFVNENAF